MNEKYITISAISFVISLAVSIWPRQCIDKFKKMIERQGEDPNQRVTIKKMKELDQKLYRQCVTGWILWLPFGLSFFCFGVLAVLTK